MWGESNIRSWDIFPKLESEPLNIFPVSHPWHGCEAGVRVATLCPGPESEPLGHLTQSRSPSPSGFFHGMRSWSLSRNCPEFLNQRLQDIFEVRMEL